MSGDGLAPALPGPVRHGAYSAALVSPAAQAILPEVERLCADTPAAHPTFAAAREVLALKVARPRRVSAYLDEKHGGTPLTHKGGVLKAAKLELDLLASVEKSLELLGLAPGAAAKLGFDVTRAKTLAERLAEARARQAQEGAS